MPLEANSRTVRAAIYARYSSDNWLRRAPDLPLRGF